MTIQERLQAILEWRKTPEHLELSTPLSKRMPRDNFAFYLAVCEMERDLALLQRQYNILVDARTICDYCLENLGSEMPEVHNVNAVIKKKRDSQAAYRQLIAESKQGKYRGEM